MSGRWEGFSNGGRRWGCRRPLRVHILATRRGERTAVVRTGPGLFAQAKAGVCSPRSSHPASRGRLRHQGSITLGAERPMGKSIEAGWARPAVMIKSPWADRHGMLRRDSGSGPCADQLPRRGPSGVVGVTAADDRRHHGDPPLNGMALNAGGMVLNAGGMVGTVTERRSTALCHRGRLSVVAGIRPTA